MKSSIVDTWLGGIGLSLLALGLWKAAHCEADEAVLTRAYQAGLSQSAVALGQSGPAPGLIALKLKERMDRARTVSSYDPERLRATSPFVLKDDGRFLPKTTDIHPRAKMAVSWLGPENGELQVDPWGSKTWKVALRSKGQVRPDWSAASGLVAYFDLERLWIADVAGQRYQSVAQVPELDEGGVIRFSADGTALGVYLDSQQKWLAQDLYILIEKP